MPVYSLKVGGSLNISTKQDPSRLFALFALILGMAALLIACLIVSSKKAFWYDELTSYYLTIDSSPAHMLQAIAGNVDTAPPLYHLLGWVWIRLFGGAAFSLRLFSSAGMCVAFVLSFELVRRVHGYLVALVASALIFSTSNLILLQNAEARFYGLFVAICAAAALLYQLIGEKNQQLWLLLLINAFVHASLILTHYVGFLYSGAILLAFILRDLSRRQQHFTVYGSVILGWSIFLLWLDSFTNQFSMVKAYTWIPRPDLILLGIVLLAGISLNIPFCLVAFGISSKLLSRHARTLTPERQSFRILGICLISVPFLDWGVSQFATSVFLPRYLLPTAVGWVILLAEVAAPTVTTLAELRKKHRLMTRVFVLVIGLILIVPVLYAIRQPFEVIPGETDQQFGYTDLPIVTTSPHQFLPRYYYSPTIPRYYFVLDWDAALSPLSASTAPTSYKLMEAFKAAYPVVGRNIMSLTDFLGRYDRFPRP